jgi:hypothetical protein
VAEAQVPRPEVRRSLERDQRARHACQTTGQLGDRSAGSLVRCQRKSADQEQVEGVRVGRTGRHALHTRVLHDGGSVRLTKNLAREVVTDNDTADHRHTPTRSKFPRLGLNQQPTV